MARSIEFFTTKGPAGAHTRRALYGSQATPRLNSARGERYGAQQAQFLVEFLVGPVTKQPGK